MRISKAPRKTAFVPRVVFRVVITGAGVVPFCATAGLVSVQGCGGPQLTVAEVCFDASCAVAASCYGDAANKPPYCSGVADGTFSDVKLDHRPDTPLGVADIGFKDVKPDQDSGKDALFGVADIGFKDVGPG